MGVGVAEDVGTGAAEDVGIGVAEVVAGHVPKAGWQPVPQ